MIPIIFMFKYIFYIINNIHMKIFIDYNNTLVESVDTSKKMDQKAEFLENFRNEIFNSSIFRNEFYDYSLSDQASVQKYIELIKSGNRYEIRFRDPGSVNKIILDSQHKEVIEKFLNEYNNKHNTSLYISNASDQILKNSLGFKITANQHLTILDNQAQNNLRDKFKFVIKFDREAKKDTWFKEGIKIQIINYMIANGIEHANNAIFDQESFNKFKSYLKSLHDTPSNKRRGMKYSDFEKIYNFVCGCSLDGDKESFGMLDIINKYYTSCDSIYTLSSGPMCFVSNDESLHGYLKQFKDAIKDEHSKISKYVKPHPADLLMIGSKFKQVLPLSSNLDNTYFAISLKEEEARLGKVSNYILGLRCIYNNNGKHVNGTVKEIRDNYLYNDIKNYISFSDMNSGVKSEMDKFEKMCNNYQVSMPTSSGMKYYTITCKNIKDISKLTQGLSINALSNLFFTAVISSYPKSDIGQKMLFSELINESLQIGNYGYYLAKDSYTNLSRIDKNMKLDESNIKDFSVIYTGAKNSGAIKVTNVFIDVIFNNSDLLNNAGKVKQLQLDIRQNRTGATNTVFELK